MRYIVSLMGICLSLGMWAQDFPAIDPERIDIVRDQWGVPHIFAPTDAEVAYGLAWANAEDAPKDMQELLMIGKGKNGRYLGKEGAKSDFFRHVIRAESLVEAQMKNLPEDFLRYLDGYVQGVNAYMKKHPEDRLLKKLFPVTVKDVLVSYVVALSFMTDASGAMERIYGGKLDQEPVAMGSNAYAINSKKSEDGLTYLCINPHMRMAGTFSFYEAHLKSEEGLHMYGALFHGGTSIFMGNNEHLGWGMTWNYFNRGDIYKLEMHPKKKHTYRYDNEWKKLDKHKVLLKVKVGITIPVPKKSFYSVHGPVLQSSKNKNEYYAFRYPAFMDIRAPEQWYRMNKAQSLEDFRTALDMMSIGLFNIIYADKADNIFYISNGQVPMRADSIAAMKVVPGNQSAYVWQRLHTQEELPHELNPDCNYVYNTNNTPFFATCDENDRLRIELKKYVDGRPGQNNRAKVLHQFMEENEKISFEAFQAIKFNNGYHVETYLLKQMQPLLNLDISQYPDVEDIFTILKSWNLVADTNDAASAVMLVVMDHIFKKKKYKDKEFILGFQVSEAEFIEGLREAKEWFLKYHGTLEMPLGKIFMAKKGSVEFSCPGFPDALAANYGTRTEGQYITEYGDTYTQFVAFDKNGVKAIRTQVPFGNSNREGSPYFATQAELFRTQQTKAATMDKDAIYKSADKIYHPK